MDEQTTIAELKRLVRQFSQARDWEQFHHPKDLGLALAIEVGEVLEHFRYQTNDEIQSTLAGEDARRELSHELADCLWLLLRLGDVCGIDLSLALRQKLELANLKYPVDKVRGLPHKYTRYGQPSGEDKNVEPAPNDLKGPDKSVDDESRKPGH